MRLTLNITVLTRERVYQSSDFRLTEQPGGKIVTDASTKAISIQNSQFFGLLTYTGIGRWIRRDTREFILEWLISLGDVDLTTVTNGLAQRASNWLGRISSGRSRPYQLTMVLAAFDIATGRATASVISNFEDAYGRQAPPTSLTVSAIEAAHNPTVLITGWKPAVSRDQRRWLERVTRRHKNQPERIRQAMMECNSVAAGSREGATISTGCTVIMLNRDGSGFQELTPGSSVSMRNVALGQLSPNIEDFMSRLGMTGAQLVGASFAQAGASLTPLAPPPCTPQLVDEASPYALSELNPPEAFGARARAISHEGIIAGDFTEEGRPSVLNYWRSSISSPASFDILPVRNLEGSGDLGIGRGGTVVGAASGTDGFLHAFTWSGGEARELADYSGRDSAATAINELGTAVGWASLSATDRGQSQYRPAVWQHDGAMLVLQDLPGEWGQAVAVAADGTALLWVHRGFADSLAVIRNSTGGLAIVGGNRGYGVVPLGMNRYKAVLGAANDQAGRLAVVAQEAGAWQRLGTKPGWMPSAINNNGWVAGSVQYRGFARVWVYEPPGPPLLLPYYAHHHCQPFSINDTGDVVGTATADHGSHALLWRRTPR